MFIVSSYAMAIALCVVTMICWGSWGNTQKLAGKTWRYELYYWDYVIGVLVFSLLVGFTLGSFGAEGVPFAENIRQVAPAAFASAILGGIIFNASNILLSASVSMAGLSVAFPIGVGLALVLGVFNNYFFGGGSNEGNPVLIFSGVALIVVALLFNAKASAGKKSQDGASSSNTRKGIATAIVSGVLMSTFYAFVARAMDLDNFAAPAAGKATPYVAFFIFAVGIFLSNFVFNTLVMKRPFVGSPVSYREYFSGRLSTHLVGVLGGFIWGLGTVLSYISSGEAGASISYALGQGAPMISAIWGLWIWKEFKGSGRQAHIYLALMFVFFIAGLAMIVAAK